MKYSLLDLAPVPEGSTTAEAMANSVALAQAAEAAGYHRHWLAEHHNMPGIASSATAVMIGHIAGATSRIRVGSGGIMLPNHSPLVIAEQFGTLASLYPGRIDLGLGRAPGTDQETARALRRHMGQQDTFPRDVGELMAYLDDPVDGQRVHAYPGEGTKVPVWILGSSLYGAQLAAQAGLPYAFASHFAPDALEQASEIYRRSFRPSEVCEAPYFMMALNVYAGDTDAEGAYLRSSMQQAFVRLRTGMPSKLPRPVDNIEDLVPAHILAGVNQAGSVSATGAPETVRRQLADLIDRFRPDEVIIAGQIHDNAKRIKSFQIAAEQLQALGHEAS
ncbi:LLM class flavin-dependent oxidoreductase [Pseudooceanicola sediminis]|uniref:Luciferase-like monooxygenase n=1 Tax=Pseudooceanicola sediminis TaxID=2211117 RepID=A0A399JDN0_9RHOB|nr:LLM class flavin-dependent oxidoreductase [Pseudooceanicola sediminis]KAA2316807.1 LLM class flavin-dependent oxidoreductase [Puniceibacterium sp. HSS470]RII40736.1 LLM class flavin-dependent oxidoreductase [Pseudooceanicola sediminis]|tara:strand:+ start:211827 stop:212825 length:999 start_codon:yes stop_codon:yes gene_type:complete